MNAATKSSVVERKKKEIRESKGRCGKSHQEDSIKALCDESAVKIKYEKKCILGHNQLNRTITEPHKSAELTRIM